MDSTIYKYKLNNKTGSDKRQILIIPVNQAVECARMRERGPYWTAFRHHTPVSQCEKSFPRHKNTRTGMLTCVRYSNSVA